MSEQWKLCVEEDDQPLFEGVCGAPLELGRQERTAEEPLYQLVVRSDQSFRLAIAPIEEVRVSRRQVHIESLPDGRVRIKNISDHASFSLDTGRLVKQGTEVVVDLPVRLNFGKRTVLLRDRSAKEESAGPMQSLAKPPPMPDGSTIRRANLAALNLNSTGTFEAEAVIHWLQVTMEVLQSAAGDSEFFQKAAQAAVEIVTLDSGRVAIRGKQDEWTVVAEHPPAVQAQYGEHSISRLVLKRVCDYKRTFWYDPMCHGPQYEVTALTNSGQSMAGLDSVVVAPILDREGTVIAVLYGERRIDSIVKTGKRVSKLDAMLIEVLASGVATGLARLEQERAALSFQTQLEQYFTPELARQLATRPELLTGQDVEISALFCDIRNFSRITRNHAPKFTLDWINDMLSTLSDCVLEHEGVLVDYVGDEVLAMWGAPKNQPDHAERACRAALDMIGRLPSLNERWGGPMGEAMGIGIGINTGVARVGNTGSRQKFKYGPLGDTVNVASRVQGASKYFKSSLVITRATRERLGAEFQVRRLGKARVVNIADPIELFELCSPGQPNACELGVAYEQALVAFEAGEFRKTSRILGRVINDHGDDGPSFALLARAIACIVEEPANFDPAFRLPGK
jgi:adenylate cyclase